MKPPRSVKPPSASLCIYCGGPAERVIVDLDNWDLEIVCVGCHVANILDIVMKANSAPEDVPGEEVPATG